MNGNWTMTIGAGGKWSGTIGRGRLVRFTALGGGANMSVLLYHDRDRTERYNMPDTLKAQHTSHLTNGHVLMSDNGRALCSITDDTTGWHDPIGGYSTRAMTDAKYGKTTYQTLRNDWLRSGEENLAAELVRCGLGRRDLVPVINLFSKVSCDETGRLRYAEGYAPKGASVALRTEMDTLFVLSNTPHPLDPRETYPSVPIRIEVSAAAPLTDDDPCLNHCAENRRAFDNTRDYYALSGRLTV